MTGNTTLSVATDAHALSVADVSRTADDDRGRPSTNVVLAVSDALDTDPTELTGRLYDVIDPDALDKLVRSAEDRNGSLTISFELSGCRVTVRGDGDVRVDT